MPSKLPISGRHMLMGPFNNGVTSYTYKFSQNYCMSGYQYDISLWNSISIVFTYLYASKEFPVNVSTPHEMKHFWSKVLLFSNAYYASHIMLTVKTTPTLQIRQPSPATSWTKNTCKRVVKVEPYFEPVLPVLNCSLLRLGQITSTTPSIVSKHSSFNPCPTLTRFLVLGFACYSVMWFMSSSVLNVKEMDTSNVTTTAKVSMSWTDVYPFVVLSVWHLILNYNKSWATYSTSIQSSQPEFRIKLRVTALPEPHSTVLGTFCICSQ